MESADPSYHVISVRDLPSVTSEQMREVDRIAVDEFGLQLLQMMESAGRALADVALRLFRPERATVVAGPGGNGGGGLSAARHLINRGVDVDICLLLPEEQMKPEAAGQVRILSAMGFSNADDIGPQTSLSTPSSATVCATLPPDGPSGSSNR